MISKAFVAQTDQIFRYALVQKPYNYQYVILTDSSTVEELIGLQTFGA